MITLSFTVWGDPVPQGSMVAFNTRNPNYTGRPLPPQVKPSNEADLKKYRRQVAETATAAADGAFAVKDTPVTVRCEFRFDPPKSVPKGRTGMTVSPDVDKLARAILDGLTYDEQRETGVFADDKQVVHLYAWKLYANEMRPPGAYVTVEWHEPEVAIQRPLGAEVAE